MVKRRSKVHRTTLFRTGLARGRVYNQSGVNLTDTPEGAGNEQVGPWQRDYSGLNGNSALYGGEFSALILDGRVLAQGGNDANEEFLGIDMDEDEDGDDRGSILTEGDRGAQLLGLKMEFIFGNSNWEDAGVWELEQETGVYTYRQTLDEWLDEAWEPMLEVGGELLDYDFYWHLRHWLRVPYSWALYRVPLTTSQEGTNDMRGEYATNYGLISTGGYLSYGPFGMLAQLNGSTWAEQARIRLWDVNEHVKFVARGEGEFTYATKPAYAPGVQDAQHPDVWGNQDVEDADATADGFALEMTREMRAKGMNLHLRHHFPHDVRARPDEVLVYHFQTGHARLERGTEPAGGGTTPHLVIAQPDTGSTARHGPFVTLHHWYAQARYRAW